MKIWNLTPEVVHWHCNGFQRDPLVSHTGCQVPLFGISGERTGDQAEIEITTAREFCVLLMSIQFPVNSSQMLPLVVTFVKVGMESQNNPLAILKSIPFWYSHCPYTSKFSSETQQLLFHLETATWAPDLDTHTHNNLRFLMLQLPGSQLTQWKLVHSCVSMSLAVLTSSP